MMTKGTYQLFAEAISLINDEKREEDIIDFLYPIFKKDNNRFDLDKFREFIRRRKNNESLKGLRVNPKYLMR